MSHDHAQGANPAHSPKSVTPINRSQACELLEMIKFTSRRLTRVCMGMEFTCSHFTGRCSAPLDHDYESAGLWRPQYVNFLELKMKFSLFMTRDTCVCMGSKLSQRLFLLDAPKNAKACLLFVRKTELEFLPMKSRSHNEKYAL